ncbi:transposase, partial [Viridibacillus sp. YIM B01967]|nr:transposase [Viridibacillus soli]
MYVIFKQSRHNYGTRKIKKELEKQEKVVSRRRISRIMKQLVLVSNYTEAYFKPQKKRSNEAQIANVLNREFQQEK